MGHSSGRGDDKRRKRTGTAEMSLACGFFENVPRHFPTNLQPMPARRSSTGQGVAQRASLGRDGHMRAAFAYEIPRFFCVRQNWNL